MLDSAPMDLPDTLYVGIAYYARLFMGLSGSGQVGMLRCRRLHRYWLAACRSEQRTMLGSFWVCLVAARSERFGVEGSIRYWLVACRSESDAGRAL